MASPDQSGTEVDGRYTLVERIGRGGMGSVYRAHQASIGRDVAVKVLEAGEDDEELITRFTNEAKIISQLRHPNTLKLIDFGRLKDGQVYIVTELLEGEPLDKTLKNGPLTPLKTVRILAQICDSLEEAHGRGIIHRDLKPANIFVERVGSKDLVKVLDFGIAKFGETTGITQAGRVFGTPTYMSPEQATGQKADARSDLYSLGVIAYQCLAGRPTFISDSLPGVMYMHVHEPPVPFQKLDPPVQVDATLERLIMRLLSKERSERPLNAVDVRAELDEIERSLKVHGPVSNPYNQTVPRASPLAQPQLTAPISILKITDLPKAKPWLLIGLGSFVVAALILALVAVLKKPADTVESIAPPPVVNTAPAVPVAPPPPVAKPEPAVPPPPAPIDMGKSGGKTGGKKSGGKKAPPPSSKERDLPPGFLDTD